MRAGAARASVVDLTGSVTVGYGFIALGVVMFLVEATMPGFFLGVPASILIILGVIALVVPDFNLFSIWMPLVVVLVGLPATLVTILMYRRMAPPDAEPTTQTASNLAGALGRVTVPVLPDRPRGKVKVGHQEWSAMSESGTIPVDARVRVLRVDGIILVVAPID